MAVPVSERREGKMEVFVKALDLALYTLNITKNEKIFLPEYQHQLTNDIVETAKNIYIDAWEANDVRVVTTDDWVERRHLQLKAVRGCNRLLALMGIAKTAFHLRNKRVEYWTGKVLYTRELIRKWNKSDSKRYSKITE